MNDMSHSSKCILHSIKRLGGPVVIAFRSMVDQKVGGSNPGSSKLIFHFYSLISSHSDIPGSNSALSSQKNELKNRNQKFWDIYQGYLLTFEQGV